MNKPNWLENLKPFASPNNYKSLASLFTSVVPFLIIVTVMFVALAIGMPYWLVMLLALPAAGFHIRTFIVLHDCSHSSFLKSKMLSHVIGHVCGIITLTPYFDWQRNHGYHHAAAANLDKRGFGDIWTMTSKEYHCASTLGKLQYRVFRNPFFLFLIAPLFLFAIVYRFPQKSTKARDYFSIIFTDIVLIAILIAAFLTVGLLTFFAVVLPILFISTSLGVWLFYVQHQFEDVYWSHQDNWDLINASIKGSSFYKLPALLRWFTGNIGYHHLHHLQPRIPFYNLKKCYDKVPELQFVHPVTLSSSFKSLNLRLWDEQTNQLISFKQSAQLMKAAI